MKEDEAVIGQLLERLRSGLMKRYGLDGKNCVRV